MLLKGVDFLEAALDTNIQYLSGVGPNAPPFIINWTFIPSATCSIISRGPILIFLLPASLRMLLPGRSVLFGRVW